MTKRLYLFFLLVLFLVTGRVSAQIHGVVIDADTGEPIPYLNV